MRSAEVERGPSRGRVVALGLPAGYVALICLALLADRLAPRFDVVFVNGREVGGRCQLLFRSR